MFSQPHIYSPAVARNLRGKVKKETRKHYLYSSMFCVRHLSSEQLPENCFKGEYVGFVVIGLVLNHLGSHPTVCAGFCSHDAVLIHKPFHT
jgi:hypothetical protein